MENLHVFLTALDQTVSGKYPLRPRYFPTAVGWVGYGSEPYCLLITDSESDSLRIPQNRLCGASERNLTYEEVLRVSTLLERWHIPAHWVSERLTERRFVRLVAGIMSFWNAFANQFKFVSLDQRPRLTGNLDGTLGLDMAMGVFESETRYALETAAAKFEITNGMIRPTVRLRDLMYSAALVASSKPLKYYTWEI